MEVQLRPTAYSAALLVAALVEVQRRMPAAALEVGVGGGVVSAAMLKAGVPRLDGVDILPDAVEASSGLLAQLGLDGRAHLRVGNLWDSFDSGPARPQWDLIVCNPPQFPLLAPLHEDHPRTWSDGGQDGRLVLQPLLEGLPERLHPGGVALLTHNRFIGLDRSLEELSRAGLQVSIGPAVWVPLSEQRANALRATHAAWGVATRIEDELGIICVGAHLIVSFVVMRACKPKPAGSQATQ